jgi:predicted  nucleic acid-binding Zn-ribbon protein
LDETKLAELIRSVVRDELDDALEPIKTDISALKTDMNTLKTEMKSMNENIVNVLVECRSYTKQVESIQKRQQRVIEMLSSRTIQNEADIRLVQDEVEVMKEHLPKA